MMPVIVDGKELVISRGLCKVARLRAEHYEWIEDPKSFLEKMRAERVDIDVFTFLQRITTTGVHSGLQSETESIAVVPISTYETWWKKQINDKTRNMVRKAGKAGLSIRVVEFSEELVRGIKTIYDESPMRQGKPFKHYGKDLPTLMNSHISFVERSWFIAAYSGEELIGFAKLVEDYGVAHLMQIISKLSHQSKAPTNALIAKAIEICAERAIPYLHYGLWSKRGLGNFKKHHAFEKHDMRRYYAPLTRKGHIYLNIGLHRNFLSYLPNDVVDGLANVRSRWYALRYGKAQLH
jgi:hypothetical protein